METTVHENDTPNQTNIIQNGCIVVPNLTVPQKLLENLDVCIEQALDPKISKHAYSLSHQQREWVRGHLESAARSMTEILDSNIVPISVVWDTLPESPEDRDVRRRLREHKSSVRALELELRKTRSSCVLHLESSVVGSTEQTVEQVEKLQAHLRNVDNTENENENETNGESEHDMVLNEAIDELGRRYESLLELLTTLTTRLPSLREKAERLKAVLQDFGSGELTDTERFITEDTRKLLRKSLAGGNEDSSHESSSRRASVTAGDDRETLPARTTRARLAAAMRTRHNARHMR